MFILDLSNEKKKDSAFWNKVYKCFNDEVGRAFFCKLMEINTDNFNPQDFPVTQSKLDAFAKRLDSHEQFIKQEYILRKRSIYCPVEEFVQEYKSFCIDNRFKTSYGKITLGQKLNELKIKHKSHNGYNYYKVKLSELDAIAKERFKNKFGEYYTNFMNFVSREEFFSTKYSSYIPESVEELSNKPCSLEFYTEVHYNFS